MNGWLANTEPANSATRQIESHPLSPKHHFIISSKNLVNVSDGQLLSPSSNVPHGGAHCLRVSFTQHFSGTYFMLGTVIGTRDKGKNITVCF